MTEESSQKITGERSPRFPSDSLAKCIELTERVFSELGRSSVPAEALAKALGYASLSGASRSTMASIAYYGLIERVGNNHKVTDLALRILRPISPLDKAQAMNTAAREPRAFEVIFQEHSDCSETVLGSILLHKGFTEDGAKRAARVFKENLEFIKQFGEIPVQDKSKDAPSKLKLEVVPPSSTQPRKEAMTPALTTNELPVPVGENMVARVPFPMTEEDFELFIGTLNLWKKKLTAKPAAKPREETHTVDDS